MASKAHEVYGALRRAIERGELRPGEVLAEAALVRQFSASRTPVREAVRRLAAEGLVTLEPRRGAQVAPVSVAGLSELFGYRVLLEVAAVRLVAQRARDDGRTREAFLALMPRFAEADESSFWVVADEFDAAVAAHVPNRYLQRALRELRPHTVRTRNLAHQAPARMDISRPEHIAMADAIARGDAAAAAVAAERHLRGAERAVFEGIRGRSPEVDAF